MVNFTIGSSLFKFSWDQVAIGLWQRYPNPNSKHVLSEDVISRHFEGNKLVSKRLLTKTNKIPKWGERFVGGDSHIVLIEESVVDPDKKTFTTYTRNIGLTKIMTIEEKCVYKASQDNNSWTLCERMAWFSSPLPLAVRKPIEVFSMKRFRSNGEKASKGLDFILTSIFRPDHVKDHPLFSTSNAFKDSARKAAEMAKSKAGVLHRGAITVSK